MNTLINASFYFQSSFLLYEEKQKMFDVCLIKSWESVSSLNLQCLLL